MPFSRIVTANPSKSVLVFGATGPTGTECIKKKLDKQSAPISIHAFCDTMARNLCSSVVQGDARKESDIRKAIVETKPNWIIIAVGNGADLSKNDIRTASGKAIANVLQQDGSDFRNVQVMLVSSNGAGSSKIVVGLGIGSLISHHLRHVLADHTGQEAAFKPLGGRVVVCRPTSLTTDQATGNKLVIFGDKVKGPSIKTDRPCGFGRMDRQCCCFGQNGVRR
jgi:hypothetical protein